MVATPISAVLTGRAVPFGPKGEPSAMAKSVRDGPVAVTSLGLAGDERGDTSVHGGPDMAIHHYPFDHYAWWAQEFRDHPLLQSPGTFGENLSTSGLIEQHVCIGDRWRLGSALVEVSQARQPCWKLNHRFGDARMVPSILLGGVCGWYWRVVEEGVVAAGDMLTLLDRPHPEWDVLRVFGMLIATRERKDRDAFVRLSQVPALSASWRQRAAKIAAG